MTWSEELTVSTYDRLILLHNEEYLSKLRGPSLSH